MTTGKTWEQETLSLIERLRHDKQRAEQRVALAQRALDAISNKIAAMQTALDTYREVYGLPNPDAHALDAREMAEYQGLTPREMAFRWADSHDGEIVMNDITAFLARAGVFRDKAQAQGTLYPTLTRMPGEFERVKRGVFRRRSPRGASDAPVVQERLAANGDGRPALRPILRAVSANDAASEPDTLDDVPF